MGFDFSPIYSLPLALTTNGDYKAANGGGSGGGGYNSPLGGAFSDVFRKDPAPNPRELIRQFVGIAYACADLNSCTLASVKLRLYVRTGKGHNKSRWKTQKLSRSRKAWLAGQSGGSSVVTRARANALVGGDDDVEEITDQDHPLLKLLAHPEPDTADLTLSAFDHAYMTHCYQQTVGRAYWYIGDRDSFGIPTRIPVLRSHLMREVPDTTGKRILDYYEYGGVNGKRFEIDEIIKFHYPDPFNPHLNGYSPTMAAIEKIRIGRKEDAQINALLENMGRPDAVWSPKGDSEGGGIGSAEASRVRSAMRQQFGQAGRGGLMVSEVPGQIDILNWKPGDVVELERAKQIKTDTCNAYGVPDAKLERNAANLASAKTADEAHARDTIVPKCVRMEEVLNARLVPLFDGGDGRLFLAFDSPIPDDEVFQLEITRAGGTLGVATIDESRASLGLAPLGNALGGCVTLDKNLIPLDSDGNVLQSALPPQPTTPASTDNPSNKPLKKKRKREEISDERILNLISRSHRANVKSRLIEAGYSEIEADEKIAESRKQLVGL